MAVGHIPHKLPRASPLALRGWILLCALLNAAGWVLSILGHLDKTGYAVALCLAAILVFSSTRNEYGRSFHWPHLKRRFTKAFPLAFLTLLILAALGGLLYPPSNFDALACRTPRVLHWLDAGRWHWIPTDTRGAFNTRTCGFEWVTAPILLFFHSDRWLFLLNIISFCLMPGLVFSVCTRLNLSPRLVWHWMWLFPAGLCFVLQAGSLANDLFGATLALAAIDFALRAKSAKNPARPLRYSLLAAALMTSAKISNLTLLLPWGVAILPGLLLYVRNCRRSAAQSVNSQSSKRRAASLIAHWLVNLGILGLAILASFLPTAAANFRKTGDWTGIKTEQAWLRPPSKLICFVHNSLLLTEQNLAPPIFPWATAWEAFLERHMPRRWRTILDDFAEEGHGSYRLRELPIEEHAGLGLGLTLAGLAQVAAGFWKSKRVPSQNKAHNPVAHEQGWNRNWRRTAMASPVISLGAFMCKSGLVAASRVIAPDYGLLLPLLLSSRRSSRTVKSLWWRFLALLAFAFAAIGLILTPARPLFPAKHVFDFLQKHYPSPSVERAALAYSVYRDRWDVFAPLRTVIPSDAKVLGAATGWVAETCLWRPLGQRRVVHVRADFSPAKAQQLGMEYIVVEVDAATGTLGEPLSEWLQKMNAVEVGRFSIRQLVSQPPAEFAVVRLRGNRTSDVRFPAVQFVAAAY